MNMIEEIEKEEMDRVTKVRELPEFGPGDTVRINVKVTEGSRERVQAFEGVCIARKNDGLNSSFTVRKISYGEGVERVFPLYSPAIAAIDVVRRGDVRRAKLYYLRGLTGKRARITEKVERRSAMPGETVEGVADVAADAAAPAPAAEAPAAAAGTDKPAKPKRKRKAKKSEAKDAGAADAKPKKKAGKKKKDASEKAE